MPQQTRNFNMTVGNVPVQALSENPDRSSYFIQNQDAALALYRSSGRSEGPHVAVAGNHEGERIGPNGGNVFDNDDKDCQWLVAPGNNQHVRITETIKSFHTVKGAMKR